MLNKRSYVKKTPNKEEWCVKSENNPKWNGGCYKSKSKADDRLKQVERIKHIKNKKATTYNDKEQEAAESHWKGSPLGDGDDIGVSHKFPVNSNDIRNRKRPGYFKWLNKEQVTPYNASPADFVSSPMESNASLNKMAVTVEDLGVGLEKEISGFKAGKHVHIDLDRDKADEGYDTTTNTIYGICKLDFNGIVDEHGFIAQQKGAVQPTIKIDWQNNFAKQDPKHATAMKVYLEAVIEEFVVAVFENGGTADKDLFDKKTKKKQKRTTITDKPEEWEVVKMLEDIPEDKFKEKEIKGQTWHQYIMPVAEFEQLATKHLIKYTYFTTQMSGMPEGDFIWKVNPNGVLILK